MEPADSKLPFIQLVASASHALIGQPVCLQVWDRITLSETAAKLVSVLAAAEWTPSRFASCLGFPSARITKVSSETREEDTVKQMEGVLLAWAESMGKTATVEMALKSIYEADELDILDSILNELTVSGDTEKRNVPGYPRKLSSPQTKAQQPHFTAKSEGKPSVPVPPNLDPPPYEGQCELASEPPPLSPVGSESRCPFPAAIADSNYEAQTPIAESQPSSSNATPHTVTGTFTTTTQNSTGQERRDHQIERMLSELESLSQKMKAMEEELEEVEADRQKECLLFEKISEDWSSRINTLQKDNQRLCTEVRDLQNELNRTKQELHKALAEVDGLKIKAARLEKENAELRESTSLHNEQERMEKERLERENAELQQEVCKLKTLQEKYEKVIGEMKEKMKVTTRELEQCMGMPNKSPEQSEGIEARRWTWNKSQRFGEFGQVFGAQRIGDPATYVVKLVTVAECDLQGQRHEVKNAFAKEMKALQGFDHPRVVKYIDQVTEDTPCSIHFHVIMKYMPQGSVCDHLKNEGKLVEGKVAKYMCQLLEGLQYLHNCCHVHCNIKCSNILLDEHGGIKLADYGRFEYLRGKSSSRVVKQTSTAWWMAPEVVEGSTPSEKSDIWSAGTSMHEMLTGERPFSEREQDMAVVYGAGQRSMSMNTLICGQGFSRGTQEFLKLCISWEPSQRSDITELLYSSFLAPH